MIDTRYFLCKFYYENIFSLFRQDILHLYILKYKENVQQNLSFLFHEPKLNSQPCPEQIHLAVIKVESKNETQIQNILGD